MTGFSRAPQYLPDMIALNGRWLADKPALICDETVQSWRQFAETTARVANAATDSGLRPGDRAVVLMDNSAEMAQILFGIVRAGVVVVPLNVAVADAAVAGMIGDSAARAVFASGGHVARIDGLRPGLDNDLGDRLIALDDPPAGWQSYSRWRDAAAADAPGWRAGADDECNIIYSSGTTGLPKGIVHDHACRAAWARDMAVSLRYHYGARTLVSLGLFSNISWVTMLSTILAGGTLIVSRRFDAGRCVEQIRAQRVTHLAMVPVQFQRLLDEAGFHGKGLDSLQAMMCCGSPLPGDVKRQMYARFPGAFIELYGLTEGLVTILSPEDVPEKMASVGRPCPGQDLRILDSDDNQCAVGEAGEIVGTGRLVMGGYHNRPDADAEARWLDRDGQAWLRTGDIGRLDEDGFLYLVDRKKDMIISGGQNIFPADIEAVMLGHDKLQDVAVIGLPSRRWGETPVAVAVIAGGAAAAGELMAWTNARVGKQQRIADVIVIDELPRNPNGKVLKRELRRIYADKEY